MAYVLIRFFHSPQDSIKNLFETPRPTFTGYTDAAHTLAAELQEKAKELGKQIGVILDATPKVDTFEVTFIQPLCTIQATEGASFPALFKRDQYSHQGKDTPLYQGLKDLPKADLGGELDNLKGSDGTFDLVYMKELYDGKEKGKDGKEKGKPKSNEDITKLINEIADLIQSWC